MVLTNNHVIESGGTVSVRLADGRTVPASVVAADATHDLALVQASGLSGLTPATFGTDGSVAIATASDESTGNVGVGFAIPADTVTRVVQQLETRAR